MTLQWIWIIAPVSTAVLGYVVGQWRSKSGTLESKSENSSRAEHVIFQTLVGGLIVISASSLAYVSYILLFDWPSGTDGVNAAAALGQRGDFFGGFVNPVLTFVTFAGFLYTVWLQRREMQHSRADALKATAAASEQNAMAREQNYQASFFNLLGAINAILASIRIKDPVREVYVEGRAAFRVFYSNLSKTYKDKKRKHPKISDQRVLLASYLFVWNEHQYEFGHYFRTLYNAILVIENGPDAERYLRLLRAQLSNQELLVLYYNCAISPHGAKFKALAERHCLFDNMPPQLLEESHAKLLNEAAFGPGGYEAALAARKQIRIGELLSAKA